MEREILNSNHSFGLDREIFDSSFGFDISYDWSLYKDLFVNRIWLLMSDKIS